MSKIVGFSQHTKRAWLDALLDRLVETTEEAELRAFLDDHLADDLPGPTSRAKSAGIVLRIWRSVPPERARLRDRAVAMLPRISGQERMWLHWGMAALAYPFFRDAAEVVGRLLALQDDFTSAQVQGRMVAAWGDRATTNEAVRKLLNTLVDWEVLRSAKTKGHFLQTRRMTASAPELQLWLLEALLAASAAEEIEAQQLLRLPESFPFSFSVGMGELRRHEAFDIHRQGLDMDMVAMRKVKFSTPPKPAKKPKAKARHRGQLGLFDQLGADVVGEEFPSGSAGGLRPAGALEQEEPGRRDEQRRTEKSIRAEFVRTLSERANRYLQASGTLVVPPGPFAAPIAECAAQFRDGHYFGCITLSYAVVDAAVRQLAEAKLKRKPRTPTVLNNPVEALHSKGIIGDACKSALARLWTERRSLQDLASSDRRELEQTARNTLRLAGEILAGLHADSP